MEGGWIMYCGHCGMENADENHFCVRCGAALAAPVGAATGASTGYAAWPPTVPPDTGPLPSYENDTSGAPLPEFAPGYPANPPDYRRYAPVTPFVGTSPMVWTRDQLVGFGPRLLAWVIDMIVLGVASGFLAAAHLGGIAPLADLAYFLCFWSTTGATVGMLALQIRVVRADGQPLSALTGLMRYAGYLLSIIALFLGLLWVLWDREKQGWHDKLAGTVVVPASARPARLLE
jgi:uncharacterized RDD family membrane protein YckC